MLAFGTASCGPTAAPTPTPSASGSPAPASTTVACTLPITQDPYVGFHIGVPPGWEVFRVNGAIGVKRDASGTEETMIIPALLTAGLTPATMFTSNLETLKATLASFQTTMTYQVTSSGTQPPHATLSLQEGQISMAGQASLAILAEASPYGSSQGALIAGWAPASQFATESPTLAAIGACYGPQSATLYRVMQDQVFTYPIPPGWSVTSETQDTIDISNGADVLASFALALAPPGRGINSPQTLREWAFGQIGIHVDQVLVSVEAPNTQTVTGATQGGEAIEFTGKLNDGQTIHGEAAVVSTTGAGTTSGVLRIAVAPTNQWNSLGGVLLHIALSIQHSFTQDMQQWEKLSQQMQAFAQQVQGFDYALTGVDLVHDPTTGQTFEAPYAAYNKSGPNGPGYYSPADTKLQILTP